MFTWTKAEQLLGDTSATRRAASVSFIKATFLIDASRVREPVPPESEAVGSSKHQTESSAHRQLPVGDVYSHRPPAVGVVQRWQIKSKEPNLRCCLLCNSPVKHAKPVQLLLPAGVNLNKRCGQRLQYMIQVAHWHLWATIVVWLHESL